MAQCEMASFPLAVLLAFSLSFAFVSTLSDKQHEKLDEIEKLLQRLQSEIDHMRGADATRHITKMPSVRNATDDNVINGSNYDNNNTESSFETNDNRTDEDHDLLNHTTPVENTTKHKMKVDSYTTVSNSTSDGQDSATTSFSNEKSSSHDEPEVTTVPGQTEHQENFQSTDLPRVWVTQTKTINQTTAEEMKDKEDEDKEDKDKGNKDKEKNEKKNREEEDELREVQNVRRLIAEGEDLERQLKGVFTQLRSLSQCTPVGEKCGVREGFARCCKGLKCNGTWSGVCNMDCVAFGQSCAENFFCCSGSQCMKSIDRKGNRAYICQ